MADIALSWVLTLALVGQVPAAAPPKPKEIAAAIQRLGDDRFAVREQANEEVWQFGEAAEPALEEALKNPDAEIRIRAAAILERFKLGLYPDTPPESAALIQEYRSTQGGQRPRVIEQLKSREDWRTLTRLLKIETNESLRSQIRNALRGDVIKRVTALIEANKLDEAEQLLVIDATFSDMIAPRQLATLYAIRGTLEDRVKQLEADLKANPSADKARLLLALAYAAGQKIDVDKLPAVAAGALGPNTFNTLVTRHDWPAAAKKFDEMTAKQEPRFETLSYAAIYRRLAGDDAMADKHLEEAIKLARPDQAWQVQEALLLHGRIDKALDGLKTVRPTMAFEILCVRQEFETAFAIADLKPGRAYDAAWFEALPPGDVPEADAIQRFNRRHILALQAAYFLHQVGEKKDAEAIFTLLRDFGKTADDASALWRRSELCRIQARLGLEEQAFADGIEFVRIRGNQAILPGLFGRQGAAAQHWDASLGLEDPELSPVERLQRIRRLLRPTAEQKKSDDWKPLVEASLKSLPAEKGAPRFSRIEAVAEVYLAQGQRQAAIDLLGAPDLSSMLYLRGGDLLREDRRFDEASEQYAKIVAGDTHRTLGLYLRGVCETAAGRVESGHKLKNQAVLLAMDNPVRVLLFQGLASRQLREEAAAVRKLWMSTSPDLNATLTKEYADSAMADDPELAARCLEHLLVRLTSTGSSLTEDAGYIAVVHSIHRAKVKAALVAGDRKAFQSEIATCQQLLPNEWGMLDELIPQLDAAGWKAEADALFDEQLDKLRGLTKRYPRAARFSNALAWVSATSKRNLDEALSEAERTLKLAPDNASYIDTLAEVHFARGNFAEAVAAQRRAVELSPVPLFRERLAKFEAAAEAGKR